MTFLTIGMRRFNRLRQQVALAQAGIMRGDTTLIESRAARIITGRKDIQRVCVPAMGLVNNALDINRRHIRRREFQCDGADLLIPPVAHVCSSQTPPPGPLPDASGRGKKRRITVDELFGDAAPINRHARQNASAIDDLLEFDVFVSAVDHGARRTKQD